MFDDEMLTIDDLASYLKLRPQTIYKWAQSGKIPGAKFGKEWRFRRSHIEDWIDDRMAQHGAPTGPKRTAARGSSTEPDLSTAPGSSAKSDPSAKPGGRNRGQGVRTRSGSGASAAEEEDGGSAHGVADSAGDGDGVAGDGVAAEGAEPGKRAKRRRPGADFN